MKSAKVTACPHNTSKVIDTKPGSGDAVFSMSFPYIRYRKRQCHRCRTIFYTFELTEETIKELRGNA